jgi:type IV fimbrial biogenesis protein FimT
VLTHGRRNEMGFTLIEVLIVITIIGIAVALGLPSYQNWIQSSQIRTAAESILNGVALARSEAVTRNESVTFTLDAQPSSIWTVADANGTIQSRPTPEGSPKAQVNATQGAITFSALGRVTPPAAVTIDVTNPTGGACADAGGPMRCLRITVNGGQVRMCDPAVALAASPRGC